MFLKNILWLLAILIKYGINGFEMNSKCFILLLRKCINKSLKLMLKYRMP